VNAKRSHSDTLTDKQRTRRRLLKGLGAVAALPALAILPDDRKGFETATMRFKATERHAFGWVYDRATADSMNAYSAHLARSMLQTKETLAANILNRAFQ
jgi:hypothetical protein